MNYKRKRLEKTWYDLTPSDREKYINQDYIYRNEELRPTVENNQFEYIWGTSKSEKKLVYELYFLDKMPVNEIMYHVSYSRSTVFKIIQDLNNSINDICRTELMKEILKLHFKDKISSEEIATILKCRYNYVRRIIVAYVYLVLQK